MKRLSPAIAVLGTILTLTAWGCGGSGPGSPIEAYVEELAEVSRNRDQRHEQLGLFPGVALNETPDAGRDTAHEWLDQVVLVYSEHAETLATIDPPEEATEAHAELVGAAAELADSVARQVDELKRSESAFERFIEGSYEDPDLVEAGRRWDAACFAIQNIAAHNGLRVRVEC